jgi:hypothetical protein
MRKIILSVIFALFLLSGCKTKEVIQYVDKPYAVTNTVVRIDSIEVFKTDSFREYIKGDTIYRDSWKTLYKDRIRIQRDTLKIPFEVRVPFEVEKEIIKYKHDTVWWIGLSFIVGALLFGLYKIIK